MAAKISICIPSYRGAHRLERLFATFPDDPDLELLLFDDGSPVEEGDAMKRLFDALPLAHKRRFREVNRGPVAALRDLVDASTGELVLQLDDDVLLPPGLIATVRKLLGTIDNVGVLSWRSKGPHAGQSDKPSVGMLQPATQLAGYCMAYRRAVYDEVGGIDTRFRIYCSDSDFTLRVALAGHPCYRVWWPLVPHKEHAAFKDTNDLDRESVVPVDLKAFRDKWGATGEEMERRAIAGLLHQYTLGRP
jgi:GT2 family glycosyltransferase